MEPSQFNLINFFLIGKVGLYKNPLLCHIEKKCLFYSGEGKSLIFSSISVLKFSVKQITFVHICGQQRQIKARHCSFLSVNVV